MMDVIAGRTAALLSQWYSYEGGPLVDLDATPTIGITRVVGGAVVLAPTATGVSHPGTGSYGYGWTPAADLAPGLYLALWNGTTGGSPVTATETVNVTAPAAGRVYATVPEYEAYPGGTAPAPANTGTRLAQASQMLDRQVLRGCLYDVDNTGMPTHPLVRAAFRDAVCAQVAWWAEVGNPSGADGAGWSTVSIGSVTLGGAGGDTAGGDSAARQIAPAAWDALLSPDLTACIFRMGAVFSC
ncbi:MAG TPA: hypothetical protein VIU15_39635 [Streptomyces sp.]